MPSLVFYGGVNEIGGNKILLKDNGTSIFLDFGMSFSLASRYFSEYLQPRKCGGIGDFIEFGLLPDLCGIYRKDYIKHCGRSSENNPSVNAVLVTHAHMDHSAYVHHLREDINIFCSKPTWGIMKAIEDTASAGFTDLVNIYESFSIRPKKKGEGMMRAKGEETKKPRNIKTFEFNKKFKIDSIEIEPLNVDHSLPGSTAFLIHTSEGTIVYTGDIRFHGRRLKESENFVAKAAESKPIALICEGTRVKDKKSETEEQVEKRASEIAKGTKALTVVNYPIRDLDRMQSFYNAAAKTGKKLVIDMKQAYILDLFKEAGIPAIRTDDPNIAVYAQRKDWGLIGRKDYPENIVRQDYDGWEQAYLDRKNCVNYADINKNQNDFILYCNFFQLKDLIDVKPAQGSTYIRSTCEPFNEEMEIDANRARNWLLHFKLQMQETHASGHASGPELTDMIKKINPGVLFPVHTVHPRYFNGSCNRIKAIKVSKTYEL